MSSRVPARAPARLQRRAGALGARWERIRRQFEPDRSLAAFDPALDSPVGTTGIYSLRMAVPGTVLPVARDPAPWCAQVF